MSKALRRTHKIEAAVRFQLPNAGVDPAVTPTEIVIHRRPPIAASVKILTDVVRRVCKDQIDRFIGYELVDCFNGVGPNDLGALAFENGLVAIDVHSLA